jgi:2-keto-4-pentenoate hydratase/2-oxohepta-3-ene-1,7-dioic acid hydratase in catechol pathway
MKILRYRRSDGILDYACQTSGGEWFELVGNIFESPTIGRAIAKAIDPVAPIDPSVIIGIAHNYRRHIQECGGEIPEWPVFFIKLPGALNHPGMPICLPVSSHKVDYEGELAVIIGREGKNIPVEHALDYVFGYTCANDISARDWQREWGGGQFCRGKSFDGFCPLGPVIVTADELQNPQALDLTTRLNGQVVQKSSTADMLFSVAELIAFLSHETTLKAGTVILTGTPSGVGMASKPPRFLQNGDIIEVELSEIGTLINTVSSAD